MKQDFPILEYDPTRKALIEPSELIKPEDIPERGVICFFQEVLSDLVERGLLTKISATKSEIGEHIFYGLEMQGQRLTVFHTGVRAPLGAGLLEEAIAKARVLIEALDYVQRFADKIVVIKMGGSVMDDEQAMSDLLTAVVFMNTVGLRPVIVHGGGKAISAAMEERGLEVQFVQGRRYTDQRTLAVVEHVLCSQINRSIVTLI